MTSRTSLSRLAALAVVAGALAFPAGAAADDFPLAGWWPLNEGRGQTAYDISGHRNHGTLGSTAGVDANDPSWIKGIFWGSALRFGGDDFVRIEDSSALEPQQLTVSLWFRGTSSPGVAKYLLSKGGDGCRAASYGIHTSWNGGIGFYIFDGEGQVGAGPAPATVWDGKWHNASATWDGRNALLFIDGVKYDGAVGDATIDYDLPSGDGFIGAYRASCDLLFTGDIDNVMVFSKALPIAEIWKKWGWVLGSPTLR